MPPAPAIPPLPAAPPVPGGGVVDSQLESAPTEMTADTRKRCLRWALMRPSYPHVARLVDETLSPTHAPRHRDRSTRVMICNCNRCTNAPKALSPSAVSSISAMNLARFRADPMCSECMIFMASTRDRCVSRTRCTSPDAPKAMRPRSTYLGGSGVSRMKTASTLPRDSDSVGSMEKEFREQDSRAMPARIIQTPTSALPVVCNGPLPWSLSDCTFPCRAHHRIAMVEVVWGDKRARRRWLYVRSFLLSADARVAPQNCMGASNWHAR